MKYVHCLPAVSVSHTSLPRQIVALQTEHANHAVALAAAVAEAATLQSQLSTDDLFFQKQCQILADTQAQLEQEVATLAAGQPLSEQQHAAARAVFRQQIAASMELVQTHRAEHLASVDAHAATIADLKQQVREPTQLFCVCVWFVCVVLPRPSPLFVS